MAVPKEWGGHGTDFVTQALVMAELAKADSAISKTFSQCWKWSHLIAAACSEEQKRRFLKPFLEDDTFLLGKGISEPSAGSDNRLPPDDPKLGGCGWNAALDQYVGDQAGVGFVPEENLVGRARIILLSWNTGPDEQHPCCASIFKPWTWFTAARPNRFFKILQ